MSATVTIQKERSGGSGNPRTGSFFSWTRFWLGLFLVFGSLFSPIYSQNNPVKETEVEDPGLPVLEDEISVEDIMEEEDEMEFEFEEFSDEDEFIFEDGEEGDKELFLGPVRLQKVSGREGLYVFDIKEQLRTEVVVIGTQMNVIKTVIYPEGQGEIDIIDLEPGEYFIRFSWSTGGVIEKVYRIGKKSTP